MNDEYYVNVDKENLEVQVCKYVFDDDHLRGYEKILSRIHYNKKSGFIFKEASDFVLRLVNVLNKTNWKRENDVYDKS